NEVFTSRFREFLSRREPNKFSASSAISAVRWDNLHVLRYVRHSTPPTVLEILRADPDQRSFCGRLPGFGRSPTQGQRAGLRVGRTAVGAPSRDHRGPHLAHSNSA